MKKFGTLLCAVLMATLLPAFMSASAAGLNSVKISQCVQNENGLKIYFNALDELSSAVGDLTAKNLLVTFGASTLEVQSLSASSASTEGVGYVFAVDISKSLTKTQFDAVRGSLTNFVENMGSSDEAAIVAFGEDVQVLSDFSQDKDALKSLASQLEPSAIQTQLYKAISSVVSLASRQDKSLPDRRVIIILSDGINDAPGGWSGDEAQNDLFEAQVPLYTVGVSNNTATVVQALDELGEISRSSGGEIFVTAVDSISNTYEQVFARINSSAIATAVLPEDVLDGESRHLQLEVTVNDRTVTASREFRAIPVNSTEATAIPSTSPTAQPETSAGDFSSVYVFGGACLALVLITAAVIFFVIKKKKKIKPSVEKKEHPVKQNYTYAPPIDQDKTVSLYQAEKSGGETVALINKSPYTITITELRENYEKVHTIPLSGEIVIGRTGGGGSLLIDDNSVSGKHCKIALKPNGLFVTDLGSTNKTKVNGDTIAPNVETIISNGVVITIGRTVLKIKLSATN